jgi:uncharacterized membrane protein required for colicin V production
MIFSCARKVAILALATTSLAGCFNSEKVTEPVQIQSVEWFKSNDNVRKETLEKCANNPGELKETPNCKNALEAETQLSSGSLKNVNW